MTKSAARKTLGISALVLSAAAAIPGVSAAEPTELTPVFTSGSSTPYYASSAAANLVTLENEIQASSAFSIGFTTWAIIFGLSVVLFILSFFEFKANTSAEFFGVTGFVLAGISALAQPYLSHTEYVMNTVALDNTTAAQVVTQVSVSDSSWMLMLVCVFLVVLHLLNCIRIFNRRIMLASGTAGERRQRRREELFGKY